jgi:hypothetical protein
MGERKVLNKYYPPDFDPAKMPRNKKPKTNDMKVRMMLPMSVRCKTCGNFMYKGTKFNTRKEDVLGETYLGIQVFRFYWRCTQCAAEFTLKTDPQNADYIVEHGAIRNYEPWREKEVVQEAAKTQREEEEKGNAMKALENRTLDSKREMDIMAALDDMRSLNARHGKISMEEALAALQREAEKDGGEPLEDEDEAALQEYLQQRAALEQRLAAAGGAGGGSDSEDSGGRPGPPAAAGAAAAAAGSGRAASTADATQILHTGDGGAAGEGAAAAAAAAPARPAAAPKPAVRVVVVKRKREQQQQQQQQPAEQAQPVGLPGLLGGYGSSSDGGSP